MTKQEFRNEIEQKIEEAQKVLVDFHEGKKTLDEVKDFMKARAEEEMSRDFYFNDDNEKVFPTEWEKQEGKKMLHDLIDELGSNDETYRLSPYSSGSIVYTIYGY